MSMWWFCLTTAVESPIPHWLCFLHVHWCRDCETVTEQHWNKPGTVSQSQCTPPQCKQIIFGIKNGSEVHGQSSSELTGVLIVLKRICGPNLEILSWTGEELSHGQAQNVVNFDFEVKFDLEGQDQSPPKTTVILTKVFYTYGTHLVILAWTGVELSRGQASDYRTDGRTHRQTQATTITEGQNWPRVKNGSHNWHRETNNSCWGQIPEETVAYVPAGGDAAPHIHLELFSINAVRITNKKQCLQQIARL